MVTSRRSFGLTLAAALAALTLGSSAYAAPILVKNMDGISGDTGLTAGATTFTMTFAAPGQFANNSATTKVNGVFTAGGPLPTFLNSYVFNKTPIVGGGGTSYLLSSPVGAPALQVQPLAGQGGGLATFSLTNLVAFVPDAAKNTMIIKGLTSLVGFTTGDYDFSPFNPGGQYTISFNISSGDLNQIIAAGGGPGSAPDASGTSSFSLAPADVPEPASLAVFGLLTLAGGVIARRKLKGRVAHA